MVSPQFLAAFGTEGSGGGVFSTALGAFVEGEGSTAIVAEFAFAGGFAAGGADGLLCFDFAGKDFSGLSFFLDVLDHFCAFGSGNFNVHAGSFDGAKSFLVIPIGFTDPLGTARTTMEVSLGFVLGENEGFLMFLVPFRGHAMEALGDNVSTAFGLVANVAVSQQRGADGKGFADVLEKAAFLVGLGFNKLALVSFVADVTEEGELKAGLRAVIRVIIGEWMQWHNNSPLFN